MPGDQRDRSIKALRPFVPAKDFALSKKFYTELGFRAEELGKELAEMHLGPHSFLLQDYYVKDWAGNFVMHALVDDLPGWWAHALRCRATQGAEIGALGACRRLRVRPVRRPLAFCLAPRTA